jgi:excisionase family DNA binding protein
MPLPDTPRQPSEEMLSPAEAARILGVHAETVRRYIRQGQLPAQHLGARTLRIRRSDIENITGATNADSPVTLQETAGKRLRDQAAQAGVTAEEMAEQLLNDFEETISGLESGYADLDAGRVMDFEQYVASRYERRARKTTA